MAHPAQPQPSHISTHRAFNDLSRPFVGLCSEDVQAGDTEDGRGPVAAPEMARHVLRLHHQEQQRRVPDRIGPAIAYIHHSWYVGQALVFLWHGANPSGRFRESEIASESCRLP